MKYAPRAGTGDKLPKRNTNINSTIKTTSFERGLSKKRHGLQTLRIGWLYANT
jgi:hypothetical protein